MAKRRTKRTRARTRKSPAQSRRRTRRQPEPQPREPLVHPETARQILAIVLLAGGLVLALALVGVGGPAGSAVALWGKQAVGAVAWVLPPAAVYAGWRLYRRKELPRHLVVGFLISVAAVTALLHLMVKVDEIDAAMEGTFGGLVGYALSATSTYAVGGLVSLIVFVALLAVGVLVMTNRSKPDSDEPSIHRPDQPRRSDPVPPSPTQPPAPKERDRGPQAAGPSPNFTPRVVDSAWEQPPVSLLSDDITEADAGDTKHMAAIIEQTLANFNIEAKIDHVHVGPTVTQFELRPAPGVKVTEITQRSNDLALSLAAHPIRIQAPIPGKASIGVEVPNQRAAIVRLRRLFETKQFKQGGALPLALGLDVSGQPVVTDLSTMPHLLIAGQTGSGKSVAINAILMSLLFTHSPRHLRLLMVDPKRVELTNYNDIPHLLAPVIVEPPKVVNALKWVVSEMDRRYQVFQDAGAKNLVEYNKAASRKASNAKEEMPYLVIVIDELADLMQVAGKAVEGTITRIAQLARATGIHLIIATQRPSTNVITGVIKANFPSRIAFAVSSNTDSRVILDSGGADKLLGRGDSLFITASTPQPIRVQGAYVEPREANALTDFLKGKGEPVYEESVTESQPGGPGSPGDGGEGSDDPLYEEAKGEVIRAKKASTSYLQRRLRVGYGRAARLIDALEENGIIGPGEGAKPREVLVDPEE
ncbi:MAG: DNA translocase FtsK 4TM domain-containing protein [bacterium]|nr:DNA translocase FtsK 4TM domain-containing protein [bacterium]MDZ4248066.1 DNA translocase FtsK 4TM domain-containing protein [Patescibacteria group bacterium]